jgi:ComF family protein
MLQQLIDILFPSRCLACEQITTSEGGGVCHDCWGKIDFICDPKCKVFGHPFEYGLAGEEEYLCAKCLVQPPPYHRAHSVLRYNEHSKILLHRFKYLDRTHAAPNFVQWMMRVIGEALDDIDVITAVPLHKWRLLRRLYNQSNILARIIAQHSHKKFCPELLIRKKYTLPQSGLTRAQRKQNVMGVFELNHKISSQLKGKNILLIDDAMTTGATINSCTRKLLEANCNRVEVLTLAKTVV